MESCLASVPRSSVKLQVSVIFRGTTEVCECLKYLYDISLILGSGLFHLNERVIYTGTWQHGFFSMGAVGATNVGCIRIDCDPELCTNSQTKQTGTPGECQQKSLGGFKCEKGSFFGQFNLGSTIVLVFEAPEGSSVPLMASGQQIKYGEAIYDLKESR